MGKILLIAALVLLMLSFGCTSPGGGSPRNFWVMGWQNLAGVAFAIVALLLALGYMASVFLGDEKMRSWVKSEAGQLIFSMIILVLAISLVGVLDQWLKVISYISDDTSGKWTNYVNAICCDPGAGNCPLDRNKACHIELATDFLQTLYETVRLDAIAFMNNYWMYGFLSNLSVSTTTILDDKQGNLNFTPFAGLAIPADFFTILFELAVKIMVVIRAQQVFLDYVWYAFFPALLSMGLILRIFYFSRKLGGLLIAIALSSYIVFPMFYVLSDAILFGFLDANSWTNRGAVPFGAAYNANQSAGGTPLPITDPTVPVNYGTSKESKSVFDPNNQVNIDLCNDTNANQQHDDMNALADGFVSNWKIYEGSRWYDGFLNYVKPGIGLNPWGAFEPKGPISSLAAVMIFCVVIPFLALMTMLASIKYFSPLLGGDIEISVLSRLI